jgi:hypothetical protein
MKGTNMKKQRILAVALSASLVSLLAMASAAQAGEFRVYDATTLTIVPYFKSNCWGSGYPVKPTGYVDFGNIDPGTSFPWDFSDPALTDPACRHPKITFTYGFFHGQVPTNPPSYAKFNFNPYAVLSVVVGGSILGPPGTDDNDD